MGRIDTFPLGNTMSAMSLKAWLSEQRGRGRALAEHLGVPPSFVAKMATGKRPVPPEHGAAMESFTGGAFSRRDYWPDKYARIWPDLRETAASTAYAPTNQTPVVSAVRPEQEVS